MAPPHRKMVTENMNHCSLLIGYVSHPAGRDQSVEHREERSSGGGDDGAASRRGVGKM